MAARDAAVDADVSHRSARFGWKRVAIEVRVFFRNKLAVFFTFLLPVMLTVIFGAVFSDRLQGPAGQSISFKQYFLASMIAATAFSLSFSSMAIGAAIEQNNGVVKRLAGTPLPRSSYLLGKIGQALVTSAIATVLIIAIGVLGYGLHLPTTASRWFVLVVVLILGVSACALAGLAFTRFIHDAQTAPAFVQPIFLALLFISGVFFQASRSPAALRVVASLFPLKWMAQALRYAFLPNWAATHEASHHWEVGRAIGVLLLWLVGAGVVTIRSFRWRRLD
jgi:ABC-2 type transport system permease protein